MLEAASLKVPKTSAQEALVLTRKLGLLNNELRLLREDDNVIIIPLLRQPLSHELEELKSVLSRFEVSQQEFKEIKEKPTKLADILGDKLPPYALASLPHSIDLVGDIAVVEIPRELEKHKLAFGEAILSAHKRVKTVLSKGSPVSGVYRLRTFEVIAGEAKTRTTHKEHGCVFFVDLAKAYFTPRLSYEHARVASLVREGETVVDMFAGVGPFSIHIAKTRRKVRVYAVDVNPDAYEFLKKNVVVNRVEAKVTPILGDARQVVSKQLIGAADRVIMNLPEKAIEYVDAACRALRPEGGIIHYYSFSNTPEPTETARTRFAEAVEQTNRCLNKIFGTRIVRGIAPFSYQVVVDAEVR